MTATHLHRTVLIFTGGLLCACLANLLDHLIPFSAGFLLVQWGEALSNSLAMVGMLTVIALFLHARRS